ncbi:hypothetical protein FGIG_09811 [Fasciola gigantica]|uniref:Uncharacterized protein n=1 Tax=Fasciola gigantica TaxID=46835 RepID=A0A504Y843_FASGI|nr:hypothetical protein FGIG_09811 [Fasciola gigantica]
MEFNCEHHCLRPKIGTLHFWDHIKYTQEVT